MGVNSFEIIFFLVYKDIFKIKNVFSNLKEFDMSMH